MIDLEKGPLRKPFLFLFTCNFVLLRRSLAADDVVTALDEAWFTVAANASRYFH